MADNLKFTVIYSNTYDDSDFNQHTKTFNITIQEGEKHEKKILRCKKKYYSYLVIYKIFQL